jgi:Mrp family chromosome partitioning ATPase
VALLPPSTSEEIITLVVQRDALLASIQGSRDLLANDYIDSILPNGHTSMLQEHPAVGITPPPPSSKVPVLVILGIGLATAILVPVLRDRLDRSIRSPRVAADALDSTVLTVVPPPTRRMTHSFAPQGSETEEAFRALAATAIATDRLPKAIVIMSPTGTLQDMVAANFGAALASLGLRVALIGTDPRQRWFAYENDHGAHGNGSNGSLSFRDMLQLAHRGQLNGELSRDLVKTGIENLYVLPPGNGNADFSLDGLRPLLESLASNGIDVSVVAGPSLLEDPDATIFAWTTRSVLWTVEAGHTTEAEAKEAAARLDLAGASAFGIVMVSARQP